MKTSSPLSIPKLREDLSGRVIAPRRPVRRGPHGLRRRDRSPPRGHRPCRERRRRLSGRLAGARDGLALAVRSGGHSIHCVSEGGDRPRSLGHEGDGHRRRGRTAWARNRPDRGRVLDRGGRPRSGDRVRRHGVGRDRRDHARAAASGSWFREYRPHDRRPPGGGDRHRGRRRPPGRRRHRSPISSGRSGRRRNFGVATRFRFRLHEVEDDRRAGCCSCRRRRRSCPRSSPRRDRTGGALDDRQRDACAADAVRARGAARQARHLRAHGVRRCTEEGERALAPFRALAEPIADMVQPIPYPEIYMPDEEDYHRRGRLTMFVDAVGPGTAGRSSTISRPRRRRCGWRSSECSVERSVACRSRRPRSPTARAGSW